MFAKEKGKDFQQIEEKCHKNTHGYKTEGLAQNAAFDDQSLSVRRHGGHNHQHMMDTVFIIINIMT